MATRLATLNAKMKAEAKKLLKATPKAQRREMAEAAKQVLRSCAW